MGKIIQIILAIMIIPAIFFGLALVGATKWFVPLTMLATAGVAWFERDAYGIWYCLGVAALYYIIVIILKFQ